MADHPIDVLAQKLALPAGRRGAVRILFGAFAATVGGRFVRPRVAKAQSDCGGATPDQCQVALTLICVDLLTDEDHCGDCGKACDAGNVCIAGECQSGAETPTSEADEPEQPDDAETPPASADVGVADPVSDRTYESPQFGYRLSWRTPWEADGEAQSIVGLGDTLRLVAGETIFRTYVAEATELEPGAVIARDLERMRAETSDLTVIQEFDADPNDPRQITRFDLDATEYERTHEAVALRDPSGVLTIETRYPVRVSPDYVRAIDAAVTLEV